MVVVLKQALWTSVMMVSVVGKNTNDIAKGECKGTGD